MAKKPLHTEQMLETQAEFEAAYQKHAKPIERFLYFRTRDHQLSEDLTSSTFEKAWQKRRSFKGGSVQAWLYRIARNSLTDHWRKKQALPSDEIDSFAQGADDVAAKSEIDQALLHEQLQRALEQLSEDMRQVVQLRFIEKLSAREVGRRLNLSEANVRVIQLRALRKLRGYLE